MPELPEGYIFAEMTRDDIPALIRVDRAASTLFEPTGLLDAEALDDHVPEEVFAGEMPKHNVFGIRDAYGRPVGFALVRERSGGLYLDQISVDPAHGRQGLGRALMLRVINEAESRRLPHVSLSTFRDLPWNGPFYASMGFKELARDKLEPYMREIEEAQKPYMDVTARCFMRRRVRRAPFWMKRSA